MLETSWGSSPTASPAVALSVLPDDMSNLSISVATAHQAQRRLPPISDLVPATALAAMIAVTSYLPITPTMPKRTYTLTEAEGRDQQAGVFAHMEEAYSEMESYRGLPGGWDGEDSVGPSSETIDAAEAFLRNLPEQVSAPEAGATGDGYAEWYWRTPNGVATVSIKDRKISYYARSSGDSHKDSFWFDGHSLPQRLVHLLQDI